MKKMRSITLSLLILLGAFSFNACKNGDEKEANPLADSLQNVNGQLNGKLSEKELALQEFIASFNEIQENLNTIKEKEKIVNSTASSKGDVKSKEGQIKEDIQSIYDLMNKNKDRIGSLSKKLKDSKLKISGMEQMIENLQNSLNLKDEEINELKNKVEGLNIELSTLNTNYKSLDNNYKNVSAESAAKTEALNTAYYAIGTKKELKDKNVISKAGGFIGIGKTTKVSDDFNKEYFTKINIEQTTSINLGVKKVKILTNHPKNSYKLVGEKPIEKLEIINAKDFWSASKYLVIIVD